jgi:hypothetical protein
MAYYFREKITGFQSMKKMTNPALWVLSISLAALFSCNDPTVIGSDLLSGDQLDIEFTDTLTLRARTVTNDSFTVWGPTPNGVNFQNFVFGDFQDPIFGRSVASIYSQFVTSTSLPRFEAGQVLDSVVLLVAYNKDLSYGKLDEPFTMEVYRMSEGLDADEKYINTDSFSVFPAPLASATFIPNLTDSLTVLEPNADTMRAVKVVPHLRIRMDGGGGIIDSIFSQVDSATFANDSSFLELLKGFWLKPASQNHGMLSFNMRNTNTALRYYYTDGTDKKTYDFRIFTGNPVVLHQRNYYAGSEVAEYLAQGGEISNDSVLFMQGLNGVNIDFEIPYADELKDVIINKAELVLPIRTLPNDTDDYGLVAQIYATERVTDDSLAIVEDIFLANLSRPTEDFGNYFGGRPTTDGYYKLSLTAHLQRMLEGNASKNLRLTVYVRSERAARLVLAGPSHPTTPAKLRVSFTRY